MIKKLQLNIVTVALLIFSLLGLVKIASIIPFNRMAGDDYSSAIVGKDGVWNAVVFTYKNFMGRFTAVLIETPFSTSLAYDGKMSIYSIVTFSVLFVALLFLIKQIFNFKKNNIYLYIIPAVLLTVLYQMTPNKSESWYWLTGSVVYLWPIIFFIFATSFIFKNNLKTIDYILASLSTFFSVGGNEALGIISLITLFVLTVLLPKKRKILIPMFLSSLISFLIVFFSPGNDIRKAAGGSEPMSYLGSVLYSIAEGPKLYKSLVLQNMYMLVPLSILLIDVFSKQYLKSKILGLDDVLLNIFLLFIAGILISILFMLPSFVGLGRVQPDRSQITLSFFMISQIVIFSYLISQLLNQKLLNTKHYKLILLISVILLINAGQSFTDTLASDLYTAKNYAAEFDSMIENFKNSDSTTEIKVSLPDSGLIAEMIDPPGKWSYKNLSLSQYYNIGKVISVEYEKK